MRTIDPAAVSAILAVEDAVFADTSSDPPKTSSGRRLRAAGVTRQLAKALLFRTQKKADFEAVCQRFVLL